MAADGNADTTLMGCRPASGVRRRRWLIRAVSFAAILFHGISLISSPQQLMRLLDAAFDTTSAVQGAAEDEDYVGFRPAPDHRHIRTRQYTNSNSSEDGGVGPMRNNNGISSAIRISFELHDPNTVPLTNIFNPYIKCPLGKLTTTGRSKPPSGPST